MAMSEKTRAPCGVEVTDTVVTRADNARIGYMLIKPPLSHNYEHPQETYKSGLNPRGKIIGRNATIPYPGELPKYHDIPFLRNVEWVGGTLVTTNADHHKQTGGISVSTCTGDSYQNTLGTPEIDEYFTADNDEGYRKWAEKKLMTCGQVVVEALEEKNKEKGIECMQNLSPDDAQREISSSVCHYMPVRFPTTNQMYGSYIDLAENYPTIRRLRPKKPTTVLNTISRSSIDSSRQDKKRILSMLGLEHNTTSSKTSYMVSYNTPETLKMLGQRDKCDTFPLYSPTGLEMNRIPASNRSIFSNLAQQQLHTRPSRISLAKIPTVQYLRTSIPYCTPPSRPGKKSTTPTYIYVETRKFGL